MTGRLESAVGWLRPLVDSMIWDFCVIWKLGNDPSRFIEWMDCCCSGGGPGGGIVKEEKCENECSSLCRDVHYKHPIRTKSCEALSKLPTFMALYSGSHGEVVISNKPRWLVTPANPSNPNSSSEHFGTQVLIPVVGGLIELFSAKHIPEDEKIVELIIANCNVTLKQEVMITPEYCRDSFNDQPCHGPILLPEDKLKNLYPSRHLLTYIDPRTELNYPFLTQPIVIHTSIEGSSSGSNLPSNEYPSLKSYSGQLTHQTAQVRHSIGKSSRSRNTKSNERFLKQQEAVVFPDSKNEVAKVECNLGKEINYQSKNLVTERNRRKRIKERLHTLRALVPKISKMDNAAILTDAIDYIKELEKEVQELQDELKENKEEECSEDSAGLRTSKLNYLYDGNRGLPHTGKKHVSFYVGKKEKIELEVLQIGKRDFLIKLLSEHKDGGFGRLMHKIDCLGFQVVDVNITTFDGKDLNILRVEAINKNAEPSKLRESLVELAGNTVDI